MLKTDKTIYKVIIIFNLLCLVAGLLAGVYILISPAQNWVLKISGLISMAAMIAAGYYLVAGYSKAGAKYYKVYTAVFLISQAVAFVNAVCSTGEVMLGLLEALTLAFILTLLLSKDLGKKTSYWLCGLAVFCTVLEMVLVLALPGIAEVLAEAKALAPVVCRLAISVLLSCLLGIMTAAKYLDKAERGRE